MAHSYRRPITTAVAAVALLVSATYGHEAKSLAGEDRHAAPPDVGLHIAALQGDIDAVRQHIAAGSDLDEKDAFGSTPLIIAATFDRPEAAEALIGAGADMEIANNEGSTPLFVAAFFCRTEIVRLLRDSGADRYARNADGATAYDIVASPFGDLEGIYTQMRDGLRPLGLDLDIERIKAARPAIAEMLRPKPEELVVIDYTPPAGEDWKVSTPAEQGLDPRLVAELYLEAAKMENLFSLLVVKNGYLIAEAYFNEGSLEQTARLQSVTKSYTSALTGIALERGCLESLDQKMLDFFPEIAGLVSDPRKQRITIRHLLQMRAGYPWEETDPALWDGLLSGYYVPLIEEFPLIADPGAEFNYSNLTSNWLGIIVARASGMNLRAFAEEHLFSPIGAEMGEWGQDAEGHNNGCGDLHGTARDVARFGRLYLNDGEHNGRQVLSADWVRQSLQSYSDSVDSGAPRAGRIGRYFRDGGYGYQWWSSRVGDHHVDYAAGHGGQLIMLLDDLDIVIVVTSEPFYLQHDAEAWKHEQANFNLVGKFIISLPERGDD